MGSNIRACETQNLLVYLQTCNHNMRFSCHQYLGLNPFKVIHALLFIIHKCKSFSSFPLLKGCRYFLLMLRPTCSFKQEDLLEGLCAAVHPLLQTVPEFYFVKVIK